MIKLKSILFPLALLALPGSAAAQGSTQALYFVFKLGTTLPLTVQDTLECAAEQTAWQSVTARQAGFFSASPFLLTYSFVSPQSGAALRQDLDAFAREHEFAGTSLESAPRAEGTGGVTQEPGLQFTDAGASGFSYAVRVHDRPAADVRSVLCVTVFSPTQTAPEEPSSGDF